MVELGPKGPGHTRDVQGPSPPPPSPPPLPIEATKGGERYKMYIKSAALA